MPGYILHLTEGEMILNEIERRGYCLNERWKNEFRLGLLLPDTRRGTEKFTSHFWKQEDLRYLAIAPCLESFLQKYEQELTVPLMLGYWAHLNLDKNFVEIYWDHLMELRDEQGDVCKERELISKVFVKKLGKEVPKTQFFSDAYYYGDYTKMNEYFVEKYHIQYPYIDIEEILCPVKEVCMEDLRSVLDELKTFGVVHKNEKSLNVFELQDLEKFIVCEADKMIQIFGESRKVKLQN